MNSPDLSESVFEYVTEPAPTLPACSRATLQLLADEREYYRRRVVADNQAERLFDLVYERTRNGWFIADTRETARSLAANIKTADGLIINDN